MEHGVEHIKLKKINLKNHPQYNEKWLQEIIADDPEIIGIGDVILKDKERIHPRAGRLDLLLQDADGNGRYEVEIQLGASDESHIIRTIEYWDIERRKYPQYDHTAIIIAEDITSRFLNVISLFNGFIPIMALQVSAIETSDGVGLHFTKILDTVKLGFLDEDEEIAEPSDRNYWETKRGTKETVQFADKVLDIVHSFVPSAVLNYNRHYIGLLIDGRAMNFATLKPQKKALGLNISLPQSDEVDEIISNSGIDFLEYNKRFNRYRLKLNEAALKDQVETLIDLLKRAYELRK